MVSVIPRDGEPIDSVLRRFKKKCENEGIVAEMRKREFYEKPSAIKRREKEKAIRKAHERKREYE